MWITQVCFICNSFVRASFILPTLILQAPSRPKKSVTAKGNMGSLAQTSDIDKAETQIPYWEGQRNIAECTHTHTFAYIDRFTKAGTVSISIQKGKVLMPRQKTGYQARTLESSIRNILSQRKAKWWLGQDLGTRRPNMLQKTPQL